MKRMMAVLLVTLAAGCRPSGRHMPDPLTVEWRQADGQTLTADESSAITRAKRHMADSIRGLMVAFDADKSADFRRVEFTLTTQTNGYKVKGRYIALYHGTGEENGWPEGGFVLLVQPDGTVTNLYHGW